MLLPAEPSRQPGEVIFLSGSVYKYFSYFIKFVGGCRDGSVVEPMLMLLQRSQVWIPQTRGKKRDTVTQAPDPSMGRQNRRIQGACWPARPAESVSSGLKNKAESE